jgi:cyanate permease
MTGRYLPDVIDAERQQQARSRRSLSTSSQTAGFVLAAFKVFTHWLQRVT